MLVYHPAFDAYHCLFRVTAITNMYSQIEIERLRILDFCLLFPSTIAKFRLQTRQSELRKTAANTANPYRDPMSPKNMFLEVYRIQSTALACAAATGIFEAHSLSNGAAVKISINLADALKTRCKLLYEREHLFFSSIIPQLMDMPLYGPDGLKARSGLIDFKYDAI